MKSSEIVWSEWILLAYFQLDLRGNWACPAHDPGFGPAPAPGCENIPQQNQNVHVWSWYMILGRCSGFILTAGKQVHVSSRWRQRPVGVLRAPTRLLELQLRGLVNSWLLFFKSAQSWKHSEQPKEEHRLFLLQGSWSSSPTAETQSIHADTWSPLWFPESISVVVGTEGLLLNIWTGSGNLRHTHTHMHTLTGFKSSHIIRTEQLRLTQTASGSQHRDRPPGTAWILFWKHFCGVGVSSFHGVRDPVLWWNLLPGVVVRFITRCCDEICSLVLWTCYDDVEDVLEVLVVFR